MRKLFSILLFTIFTAVFAQQKFDITFYTEKKGTDYYIFADNNEWMPMSSQFKFKLQNMSSSLKDNQQVAIPARTQKYLISKVTTLNAKLSTAFSYTNTYNYGDVSQTTFDSDYIYELPFQKGKSYRVDQGYNGTFSHAGEFSLDFNMKVGDQITAARDGIVTLVEDSFNGGCASIACAKTNNKIIVMHNDGTFADYAHLQQKGSMVKKGDVVKKGQLLGYSGNTGFSSGPHLHFSVFINRMNGKRDFIKTKFQVKENITPLVLVEGKTYSRP